MRKALITGASSGIGEEFARLLAQRGYQTVLVARRETRLHALADSLPIRGQVLCADLRDAAECHRVYQAVRGHDLEVVINNAGFGKFGAFDKIDLDTELEMMDVNMRAVHILTKLAVRDFAAARRGYILNVASVAGFFPGPLFATYYASKNYVLRLTQAVREEQRRAKTGVVLSALCPGPVRTEFDKVANVTFSMPSLSAARVAKQGLDGLFADKDVIIPGALVRAGAFSRRLVPDRVLARILYHAQHRKGER